MTFKENEKKKEMSITDTTVIKQIVKTNFDKSVTLYEKFEKHYKFFTSLTIELAKVCKITEGMVVCDVGCGTGVSTFTLKKLVKKRGKVIGIDFSEKMLNLAKEKLKTYSTQGIEFLLADAEEMSEKITTQVDAVLYNASIFLIPDLVKTLTNAYLILKNSGTVGMNYLIGLFSTPETTKWDLFQEVKKEGKEFAPYGRQIIRKEKIEPSLRRIGFKRIKKGKIVKKMPFNGVKKFYSIPAQSAALYPKTPYQERIELVNLLLKHFQTKGVKKFYLHWGYYVGEKLL